MTLAFSQQLRPAPDRHVVARLARALDRVGSRTRIAVHVRRWLPHDFDPEPVRRAIDLWLREVDRGGWEGRYAAYEDERVSLEFALTGELAAEDEGVVAFTMGPFHASGTRAALEGRLVEQLDHTLSHTRVRRPLLVSCVAHQPWGINPGHLLEMLLGKPARSEVVEDVGLRWAVSSSYAQAVFRDPVYARVSGVLLLHPDPATSPLGAQGQTWLGPWARERLEADQLPGACLQSVGDEGALRLLAWSSDEA